MNSKRKNRGGPVRAQRQRSIVADGVYNNAHFMHAATSQVGNICRIKTASGAVWEGVFKTFSSNFEVVLEIAAKVENAETSHPQLIADTCVDKLIFKACDILTMVFRDVDLDYAVGDSFQTDSAISARLNGCKLEEKELEPWDATGLNGGEGLNLELEAANGWDASDMFKKNELEYGVQSTFDHSLRGYTVPLQTSDSADYREAEAKANQIANEIENQPQHKARLDLENGDEESTFAAVVRPNQQEFNGKYIPPAKRKNQNNGKLVKSTPPPSNNTSAQNTPSPKENRPPLPYPQHPSPHQNHQGNMHVPSKEDNYRKDPHAGAPQQQPQHHNSAAPPPNMAVPPQHPQLVIPPPHVRSHSHTPPHQYQQRQGPPPSAMQNRDVPQGPKLQMNGEAKPGPQQRQQRGHQNQYSGNVNQQVPQQQQFQQGPEIKQQEVTSHPPPRHREDAIKDLHSFAQDFKLAPVQNEVAPPPMQVPPPAPDQGPPNQQVIPQHVQKPPQQPSPPQPSQSVSPPQDKLANTLKKSTLNPNAKEFVLNPAAKPFQPRSPSTPSASRPHTPQTPSHSPYIPASVSGPGQAPMQMVMPVHYMMTSQPQYQPPPQGNRIKRIPMGQMRTDMASQMQVAAATGQPLLAPAPMQQFIYPPAGMNQAYQPMHAAVRMYDAPPQIQYLHPNPSSTPTPAQPPPYNPAQAPQGHPQQYQPAPPPPGPHQLPMVFGPIIPTQPMLQNMQYLQPAQPPPPQHMQVIMSHQHPQGNPHGPNP